MDQYVLIPNGEESDPKEGEGEKHNPHPPTLSLFVVFPVQNTGNGERGRKKGTESSHVEHD
jgi:hypothetical protein